MKDGRGQSICGFQSFICLGGNLCSYYPYKLPPKHILFIVYGHIIFNIIFMFRPD